MPPVFQPVQTPDPTAPVAYFPYFNRTYLAVAASLNGGNVLATFVHMLVQWMADLGKSGPHSGPPVLSVWYFLMPNVL